MTEAELRAELAGSRIDGQYPNGQAFSEKYHADGAIEYQEGPRSSKGHWKIEGQRFCTHYAGLPGGCWYLKKTGENCYEFYAGKAVGREPPRLAPGWGARGWLRDRKATCEAKPSV